jgi:hypothetical protein
VIGQRPDNMKNDDLGGLMSDGSYKKQHGLIDKARELSGIYRLGFEPESFLGLAIPVGFVIVVGGLLALIITKL